MRKAVVTTFPASDWNHYVNNALASFDINWPNDIELFIALDEMPETELNALKEAIAQTLTSGRIYHIGSNYTPDQKEFLERNKDAKAISYRFQVCKFSHKVFAVRDVSLTMKAAGGYDYLIWMDADVFSNKKITHNDINEWLPSETEVVSYLGRVDAPHSECSFVVYRLNESGYNFIENMISYYINDTVLELTGWTDCDVFDAVNQGKGKNLSKDIKGWHVFPESPLGKFMEHQKGMRKYNQGIKKEKKEFVLPSENMQIKTRNCLPDTSICENIKTNLQYIKNWVEYIKPHDEPVVIASGGSSLSYTDMKYWADKGVKIVCVKHAIDRLKEWGIKPWACILLDPRGHVEEFVKKPDKDVIYFVASMVDPSVTKTLIDNDCTVIGYHALVGAGELELLPAGAKVVSGGSATATRCIGLLVECLGFKELHCYGYDLCYFSKPDMNVLNDDGKPKHIEITLSAQSWNNKTHKRTFWTEGQFLAQAQELYDIYKNTDFNIKMYGYGLAAWQQAHFKQYTAWIELVKNKVQRIKENSLCLKEWEFTIKPK